MHSKAKVSPRGSADRKRGSSSKVTAKLDQLAELIAMFLAFPGTGYLQARPTRRSRSDETIGGTGGVMDRKLALPCQWDANSNLPMTDPLSSSPPPRPFSLPLSLSLSVRVGAGF